jgi:O-antigen ligase
VVGWGCVLMGFLSESSATYVSMFVLLCIYIFYDAHSISKEGNLVRKTVTRKMLWCIAVLCILPVAFLLLSNLFSSFAEMVDTLIFKKQDSSSFIERSSWTAAGISAFVQSFGLGVGIGSVRTSNFFANIIASTGLPGAILFIIFIVTLFTRHAARRDSREEAIVRAAKLALLPMFVDLLLVGTTPDFGLGPGVLFGVIAGTASRTFVKDPTAPRHITKQVVTKSAPPEESTREIE